MFNYTLLITCTNLGLSQGLGYFLFLLYTMKRALLITGLSSLWLQYVDMCGVGWSLRFFLLMLFCVYDKFLFSEQFYKKIHFCKSKLNKLFNQNKFVIKSAVHFSPSESTTFFKPEENRQAIVIQILIHSPKPKTLSVHFLFSFFKMLFRDEWARPEAIFIWHIFLRQILLPSFLYFIRVPLISIAWRTVLPMRSQIWI